MSITLIANPLSTCTKTVLIVLEEIGHSVAPYTIQTVDLMKGEHKKPEYLERYQPFGQVPSIDDGDFHLFESRAIIRYLASKHIDQSEAAASLYPKDVKQRALVEQWLSVNQSNNTPITDVVVEFLFKAWRGGTPDESKIPEFKEKLVTYLNILDKQLAKTAFLAGDHFTLADVPFIPYIDLFLNIPHFSNSFDNHANVKRWWTAISSRESWKKTLGVKA